MRVYFYAIFFHLTLSLYVFYKAWRALEGKKAGRIALASVFIVEFIVYLIGLLLHRHIPYPTVRMVWMMGTSWMLFMLYMSMGLLIFDILRAIDKRKPFLTKPLREYGKKVQMAIFSAVLVIVVLILWRGNYKFNHPAIVHNDVHIEKSAGTIDSLRIALIGDTHFGYLIHKPYAKKYVDLIMAQKPDLILFVGDIIDSEIEPILHEQMGEETRRLHAPLGVYTCTGNHEYRYETEEKIKWLNNNGITVLRDTAILVNQAFYIVGREDLEAPFTRKATKEIIQQKNIDRSKPIIVLSHNPRSIREEASAEVDMALYGHTHRGQFFPANLVTDVLFEVSHGHKKIGNTYVHVTSGLGLSGPQYRIGSQSEIVMLNVRFQPTKN